MVLFEFVKEIYNWVDEPIRKIENRFFAGIIWLLFHGLILYFFIWLGTKIYENWVIGAWIAGLWIGFELVCLFGGMIQRG